MFACFADLDCEELQGDDQLDDGDGDEEPTARPCEKEELAMENACDSLFGEEG